MQSRCGVNDFQSWLLPFPLLHVFVVGVAEHGEQEQQWDQQVRQVDGEQHEALAQRLRARVLRLREVVEQDVGQDGKQSGGYVGGVDNGRSPDPSAATFKEGVCSDGEERQLEKGFAVDERLEPLWGLQHHGVPEGSCILLQQVCQLEKPKTESVTEHQPQQGKARDS